MSTDRKTERLREKWQKNVFISPPPPPSLHLFLHLVLLGEEMPRCRFIPRFFPSSSVSSCKIMHSFSFPCPSSSLLRLRFVLRWIFIENNKIEADKDLPGRCRSPSTTPRRRVRDPIPAHLSPSPSLSVSLPPFFCGHVNNPVLARFVYSHLAEDMC